jgi:hypothetical protein
MHGGVGGGHREVSPYPELSRRAKLGVSCRVKVPVGRRSREASSKGLATHPYRALGPWRSGGRLRTRWAKRRQRILQAVGESALPEVLVQLRNKFVAGAEGFNASEGNTKHPLWRGCGGLSESTGRGMQEEIRRRTREAPAAPGGGSNERHGIALLRHGRGNPETELSASLGAHWQAG